MRRILGVSVFAVACAGFVTTPVGAQDDHPSFDIPLDTVIRGGVGTEHELASAPVPAEDVGHGCEVVVEGANNESVHPNNDLIVRSGGSEVEALDVEREPEAITEATGTLVLGTDISVHVRLGADKVFSGGMVVTIDCPIPPTTTTTTVPATTTTAPPAATPPAPAPPAQPVPGQPTFVG